MEGTSLMALVPPERRRPLALEENQPSAQRNSPGGVVQHVLIYGGHVKSP